MSFEQRSEELGDHIELIQIHCLPGNRRIWSKARFLVLTRFINRQIDLLEFATRGIGDDRRPGFVGFAKSNRIGVARPAVSPERFVAELQSREVRPSRQARPAARIASAMR